jgi:hypothetical protein
MAKHPVLNELLETPAIRAIADEVNKRGEVPVYRLQFPNLGQLREEAYRWAYSLFADSRNRDPRPEPIEHRDRLVLQHPEGLRIRTYYASGYMEFRNLERTYAGKTEITSLREAKAVVREFAAKHTLWTLDSDQQLQAEAIRFVKSHSSAREGAVADIITNNSIVVYKRLTGEIPWVGPGSKISAIIEGKDVVGFNRYWRQVIPGPFQVMPLVRVEVAVEAMVNDLSSRLDGVPIEPGDILLERADFGYYAAGKRKLQRFLQPVYVFIYRTPNAFTTAGYVDVRLAHEKQLEPLGRDPMESIGQLKRSVLRQK